MPKKEWTDEERKAFSEKMKQIRANKNKQTPQKETEPVPTEPKFESIGYSDPVPEPVATNVTGEQNMDEMRRQIAELQQLVIKGLVGNQNNGPTAANGKLVGTVEKFPMAKDLYPNPAERLGKEPRLARFAFDVNYEVNYEVTSSEYTTIDNIRVREPKFTLSLVRKVMDEETGEPTTRRIVICNLIMHEDPDTARIIANSMDFDFDSMSETEFLNEMRYMRMRDWLIDCFYPPKANSGNGMQEMVVNGRLVQYYETSEMADDGSSNMKIDFSKLPKIKF